MNLPKRYTKFGVGKNIGGKVYLHRQYEHFLPSDVLATAKAQLPKDFNYTVVAYELKTQRITFTESVDFDTATEPSVGKQITIYPCGKCVVTEPNIDNPWIYHHKWLFVADDYSGFDVEESKVRSKTWMGLPNVDYTRIGKKLFWESNVVALL